MPQFACFHCRTPYTWQLDTPISRRETCPQCGRDLRVCKNCRHYDASRRWECKEEITEAVREKESANYCEFFRALELVTGDATAPGSERDQMMKAAEALFKK